MGGGWWCVHSTEAGPSLPAPNQTAEGTTVVTEMAEGELDVDSLISRLLEGKFVFIC